MAAAATQTSSPVDLVRHAFEHTLNLRDADVLAEMWHEDVVETFPTGVLRGRQAVRDYFADTYAALPDFHIEAIEIAGAGETVFVRWHITGTFTGKAWMGIEPTGTRLALDGMDCFTVRDGVVVANFVVYDTAEFGRQIGMLPAQGSRADTALTAAFNAKTRLGRRLGR